MIDISDDAFAAEYDRLYAQAAKTLEGILAKTERGERLTPREKASVATGHFWSRLKPLNRWRPPPHLDPKVAMQCHRVLLLSCLRDIVAPSPTAMVFRTKGRRVIATYGRHGSMPMDLSPVNG
jgi:hypothetical protein